MTVNLAPSSMHDVFDHCIVAATPAALAKDISLTIDEHADLPLVLMQSNRIIQVLSNLINNAIKFTDVGGKVTIESKLINNGERLRLSVRDTGCGIPAEDTSMVFERLYQVNPANDSQTGPGMGLGLSIASEIVRLHGSSLSVESELDVGSVFSFELPTCPAAQLTDAA